MVTSVDFKTEIIQEMFNISFANQLEFLCSSQNPISNSVFFYLGEKINLKTLKNVIVFSTNNTAVETNHESCLVLRSKNPWLAFIDFIYKCIDLSSSPYSNAGSGRETSFINPSAEIHDSVEISPGCYIGANCFLAKGVILLPGVKLIENVSLKENVIIGPASVLGGWGYSVEKRNNEPRTSIPKAGTAIKFPHFGGVIVGQSSNIGSMNTICSGTIEPTILGDRVMTDDHVHIAHNCKIFDDVCLAMHVSLSGGVKIYNNSWVGPSASILQKVTVGKESIIGIAANVIKDVEAKSTVVGNPAKKLLKDIS